MRGILNWHARRESNSHGTVLETAAFQSATDVFTSLNYNTKSRDSYLIALLKSARSVLINKELAMFIHRNCIRAHTIILHPPFAIETENGFQRRNLTESRNPISSLSFQNRASLNYHNKSGCPPRIRTLSSRAKTCCANRYTRGQ